jgi:N-terminal domain of anti-restriction factor ArdC
MGFYGQAEAAAQKIVRLFEDTDSLPKRLEQVFIRRKNRPHFCKWSWGNQLLVILSGFTDARGFRQWEQVGRKVKKGEKAFYILGPMTKKVQNEDTGEEKVIVVGFKGLPVFGYEQTEGQPLPTSDPDIDRWLASLPLLDVARAWGLSVGVVEGGWADFLGRYRKGKGIELAVKNLSTWAHELIHAADDRNGSLREMGQHWRSETVAELGAAVLLEILGWQHDADLGGCWEYVKHYAQQEKMPVTEACMKVLDRTCAAVGLILDTAEQIKQHIDTVAIAQADTIPAQQATGIFQTKAV